MALKITEENTNVPCSICGKPVSNRYTMTFRGSDISVYACEECATKEPNQKDKTHKALSPTVTCPYCSSTNCKKITGASKVGKVLMWGVLAAGSVGHTWHCNSCGSNFG